MQLDKLKDFVRTIPDYPHEGIMFRDITTLLAHGPAYHAAIDHLCASLIGENLQAIAGIEARGFILGGAMADRLGVGFVPIRKKGKLPGEVIGQNYALEYGTDRVEIHKDAVRKGDKVLLVDDLIATGGTALAGLALLKQLEADVVRASFVIDLPDLGGRAKLEEAGVSCHCLMDFEGL